jgi:hypothetical protein
VNSLKTDPLGSINIGLPGNLVEKKQDTLVVEMDLPQIHAAVAKLQNAAFAIYQRETQSTIRALTFSD